MANYTQDDRLIAVYTVLDPDVLLLRSFKGVEAISRPFHFQLDLLSENRAIKLEDVVGAKATIRVKAPGQDRYINGIVSRISQGESGFPFVHYQAEVVPWFSLLDHTADCRIFQKKTVVEIIQSVFDEAGFKDYRNAVRETYQPLEYCVQYRETDFAFVSRLMEEYGIFYFFEHTKDTHTLVFADSAAAHNNCPGQHAVRLDMASEKSALDEDSLSSLEIGREIRSARYALADHNFEAPNIDLLSEVASKLKLPANLEVFDYPGNFRTSAQGDTMATIRIEEEEAGHLVATGEGHCRSFVPGFKFDLKQHFRKDANGTYLLTKVRHKASVGDTYVGDGGGETESYENDFKCIPIGVPFRPARRTAKPVVQGCQTAVVVGPKNEEIWVDKYGRVKVQFYWDRRGKGDDESSCWIRVSTAWAGNQWGTMMIPRVGQEVLVDFEQGDPDRPIIIGALYNAQNMPAYTLPDEKTKSGIKSLSSKQGGGFNEIRFEDKKDSEQVFIHAQRNLDARVVQNRMESIGGSANLTVAGNQLAKVSGDKHLTVEGDQKEQVDGGVYTKVGRHFNLKVDMRYGVYADQEVYLGSSQKVQITSNGTLTLQVGGNFISITPAGIFISGTIVNINSGGSADSPGPFTQMTPETPVDAANAVAGAIQEAPRKGRPPAAQSYSPAAANLKDAAQNGASFASM
jgi:type VI secretion system secreted protein VgrG